MGLPVQAPLPRAGKIYIGINLETYDKENTSIGIADRSGRRDGRVADKGMWLPSLISSRIKDMRSKGIPSHGGGYLFDQQGIAQKTPSCCSTEAARARSYRLRDCCLPIITAATTPYRRSLRSTTTIRPTATGLSRARGPACKGLQVAILCQNGGYYRPSCRRRVQRLSSPRPGRGRRGYAAAVEQMYYGNEQYLFVYRVFDDVRLVGTPPSSIRQVRRRHRQLDMAAPYWRLFGVPHIRFARQRACGLLQGQRALSSGAPLRDIDARCRRGRLHDDIRFPGQHAGVHHFGCRRLYRQPLRSGQDRPSHRAAGHHPRGAAARCQGAHTVCRQACHDSQRVEEVAGRGARNRASGERSTRSVLTRRVSPPRTPRRPSCSIRCMPPTSAISRATTCASFSTRRCAP